MAPTGVLFLSEESKPKDAIKMGNLRVQGMATLHTNAGGKRVLETELLS